jgi:hypothetical protein
MLQAAPRPSKLDSGISLLSDRRIGVSIRPITGLLALVLFFVLVFVLPVPMAAANKGPTTSVGANPQEAVHAVEGLGSWLDTCLLVLIAFLFALLGLLKDFRRYRGLLPVLFSNFYSWVFITFTAACIFAVDYEVFQWVHRHITNPPQEAMLHLSLVLGHTGVSAAFVYVSPFLLSFIPTQARRSTAEPSLNIPEKEKPITEMNVVYAAIRESLENQVNGRVSEWTDTYSWPVIKHTGKMLLIDLLNSGTISHGEFENAKLEEEACEGCGEFWENRQRKYDLLRRIMKHSSYQDLSSRLERTAKAERVGAAS